MKEKEVWQIIIETTVHIFKNLGPGLLENVYEAVLMKLLSKKGLSVQRKVPIPIKFDGDFYDVGFRADLLVEGKVIIELVSEEKITPVHRKQLLTYLKLINTKLGFIINFGSERMEHGIVRVINEAGG